MFPQQASTMKNLKQLLKVKELEKKAATVLKCAQSRYNGS
jgi:hypothetical protein